jgi:hypothetical protein
LKADFTLRGHDRGLRFYGLPGWLGQGRVRRATLWGRPGLKGLVDETKQWHDFYRQEGLIPVLIWAIHFDPFTTDGTLQLLGSDLLVQAAQDAGVTAILCGHTHESKIKPLSATTTVYACGSTAQAGSPQNDCQVLEVDVPEDGSAGPSVRVTWFRYDNASGQFRRLMAGSTS